MGVLKPVLHADNSNDVANGTFITMVVKGPADVNRLLVFTGTAIFDFSGDGMDRLTTANVEIVLMEKYPYSVPKDIQWSATYLSLASEASDAAALDDNDECEFDTGLNDGDISTFLDGDGALKLRASLLVYSECHFNRVAYQANVLAHAE